MLLKTAFFPLSHPGVSCHWPWIHRFMRLYAHLGGNHAYTLVWRWDSARDSLEPGARQGSTTYKVLQGSDSINQWSAVTPNICASPLHIVLRSDWLRPSATFTYKERGMFSCSCQIPRYLHRDTVRRVSRGDAGLGQLIFLATCKMSYATAKLA